MSQTISLNLNNLREKKFAIINDPTIRFGSLNAMALVDRIYKERPTSIDIVFDQSDEAKNFLTEIAEEVSYKISFEGNKAILVP